MWVKCTMKVVNLESPLETDTWLLKESCWDSRGRLRPCTHFSSQILENREERKGEKTPSKSQMPDPGLFKSINYFLALFKGFFLMNIYGTGCFQSREEQTLLAFFFFIFLQQEQKEKKLSEGIFLLRWPSPPDTRFSRGSQQKGFGHTRLFPPTPPLLPLPGGLLCSADKIPEKKWKVELKLLESQLQNAGGGGGIGAAPGSLVPYGAGVGGGGGEESSPASLLTVLRSFLCRANV